MWFESGHTCNPPFKNPAYALGMFCAGDSLCNISHFFIALYSIRGSVARVLTMYNMSSDFISNINIISIMMMIIYYSSSIIVKHLVHLEV